MPEVSVIVPVYNKQIYLPELFRNLKEQTYMDFECIMVDDGSTDGSGNCCDELAYGDKRFKIFHIENGGVSRARNFALDYVSGKYVTFVDADDCIHPDYLKNLYECISENQVDMVIESLVKVWEDSERQEKINVPYVGEYKLEEIIRTFAKDQLATGIYGFCCGKMFSFKLIGNLRFNESIRLAEDLDFYISLYPKIKNIYFSNKGYYYYLQAAENSSMQGSDDEIDYFTQLCIQLKIYNFLQSMDGLSNESNESMIHRLYDYVFFTLYHSPIEDIKKYCTKIRELKLPEMSLDLRGSWQYRWIVGLYRRKADNLLILTRKIYGKLRKMLR